MEGGGGEEEYGLNDLFALRVGLPRQRLQWMILVLLSTSGQAQASFGCVTPWKDGRHLKCRLEIDTYPSLPGTKDIQRLRNIFCTPLIYF
jgi:hypothetical protein